MKIKQFLILVSVLYSFNYIYSQSEIKLYIFYTPSHEVLLKEWFLPSLPDEYTLVTEKHEQTCQNGVFMKKGWNATMLKKVDLIIRAIRENWNKVFVHADIDIQFFRTSKDIILRLMNNKDMMFQRDNPSGELCAGFFACRGNNKTLRLFQDIKKHLTQLNPNTRENDQTLLNTLLRKNNFLHIRWGLLPKEFYGPGIHGKKIWKLGETLDIPNNIILHHANWTVGIDNKIAQLAYVKNIVEKRRK